MSPCHQKRFLTDFTKFNFFTSLMLVVASCGPAKKHETAANAAKKESARQVSEEPLTKAGCSFSKQNDFASALNCEKKENPYDAYLQLISILNYVKESSKVGSPPHDEPGKPSSNSIQMACR